MNTICNTGRISCKTTVMPNLRPPRNLRPSQTSADNVYRIDPCIYFYKRPKRLTLILQPESTVPFLR